MTWVRQLIGSPKGRATFGRFVLVAAVMATIDTGVLYALAATSTMSLHVARVFSLGLAMTAGYFLNRRFTFNDRPRRVARKVELLRFYGAHGIGGAFNLALFAVVIEGGDPLQPLVGGTHALALTGIVIGGIGGMSLNFLLSNRLVFARES